MEVHSRWYDDTVKELNLRKDNLSRKDSKKCKLELLLRITTRLDSFASYCALCQLFQKEITRVIEDIDNLPAMSKEQRKNYFKVVKVTTKHLKQEHKLIGERHNIGLWIAVGATLGIVVGSGIGKVGIGIGIAIGAVVGLAIGIYFYARAKKEGRLI